MSEFPSDDLDYGVKMGEDPAPRQPAFDPYSYPEPAHKDEDAAKAAEGHSNFDLKRAGHPSACIATFGFKAAGIIFYLLIGNLLSDILTFIFVILFSSMDFWVVKNITGRLLVGLRWWS